MRTLPTHSLSIFSLILTTIRAYFIILPKIFWLVAISSIGHLIIPYLYLLDPTFAAVGGVGFILLIWFFYTAILDKANTTLLGERTPDKNIFRLARQRYLWILGSNIIFFGIGIVLLLVIFSLNLLFDLVNLHPGYLALSLAISLIVLVYLYFAIPEIALEKISLYAGFEKSIRLVRYHWWRTFIVLALVAAAILGFEALGILFTGKSRMFLFTGYHFLVQLVFYPLIISATLVLMNDLKLRHRDYQNLLSNHTQGVTHHETHH